MNIVICIKYVPDAQADLSFSESDNTTDRLGVDGLLSELDEYAIEAGLKLAESAAEETTVTVLTVGPDKAADAITISYAVRRTQWAGSGYCLQWTAVVAHCSPKPPTALCAQRSLQDRPRIDVCGGYTLHSAPVISCFHLGEHRYRALHRQLLPPPMPMAQPLLRNLLPPQMTQDQGCIQE